MATAIGQVRAYCAGCRWHGHRVPRDQSDPNRASEVSGLGSCPNCGDALARATALVDRRAAKAKAELHELAQGARL